MEFTATKAQLSREVQLTQGIVERKNTVPILANLLLRAENESLTIAATDLDVSLRTTLPARIKKTGGVAVSAKKFFEIVRSLPDADVHVKVLENNYLEIKCERSSFRLVGLPAEDFPTLPLVDLKRGFTLPLDSFQKMLAKVIFAITQEETRFQLNGALFKIKEKSIELVATDGHRLALVQFPHKLAQVEKLAIKPTLIQKKALAELLKFEDEGAQELLMGISENHLFFKVGERVLISRVIEANFPNYERVIAQDNQSRATVATAVAAQAIRRVALLSNERSKGIRLSLESGTLTISTQNPDLGEAQEQIDAEYEGDPIKVGLNAQYLLEFLSAVESDRVAFDLRDENSQCLGQPVFEKEVDYRYLYVVMPMRL